MAKTTERVSSAEFIMSAPRWDKCPDFGQPELLIAGRSNVGKSSFINFLLGKKGLARTSSTPGRTQTPNIFRINEAFILVDLPGYGYAKAPKNVVRNWTENSKKFIAMRPAIAGIVQLMDIRRDPSDHDTEFFRAAIAAGRAVVLVVTKADKVSRGARGARLAKIAAPFGLDPAYLLVTSAQVGEGRKEVWQVLQELFEEKHYELSKSDGVGEQEDDE